MTKKHPSHSPEVVELVATRFRTLGEPIRLVLLHALQDGERNVTDLVAAAGSTQPNVSKHMRILQEAGFVSRRQEGNSVYYAITDPSIFALCDAVCRSVGEGLQRNAKLAQEMRRR